MNNEIFDIGRCARLFNKQFVEYKNRLLATWVLVFVCMMLLFVLLIFSNTKLFIQLNEGDSFLIFYLVLIGGGILQAEKQLGVVRSQGDNWFYFTLPTSKLEKFVVAWLFSTLVYLIACISSFYVTSALVQLFFRFGIDVDIRPINLFSFQYLYIMPLFLVIQQFTFFGLLFFKKFPLPKIIALFVILLFMLRFIPYDLGYLVTMGNVNPSDSHGEVGSISLFWVSLTLTSAVLLILSYNYFKNKEIKSV